MEIINYYPGSWGSNCYLLLSGTHAAIVDPSADADTLQNAVRSHGAALDFILLTHGHFDHIVSIDTLRDNTGVPVMIHEHDLTFPEDAHKNAFYPFFHMERTYKRPDKALRDNEILSLGDETIRVIHTPGHTAGSVCFLCANEFLITGDTLFDGGCGRTDLYSGDETALYASLGKLSSLSPALPIYPGHGSGSSLGDALGQLL